MSPELEPDVRATLAAVRERGVLVHCVSAAVSYAIVADGLLAAGARPMMTETVHEAPVVTTVADALLINLGTLSVDAMASIPATVDAARAHGVPWVLDPTAVGIAPVRTPLARALLAKRPAVIRGNASEILVLAGTGTGGRGADSADPTEDAVDAARGLVERTGAVVAVSGAVDRIVGVEETRAITGGSPMLTRVTGTGCLLGALTAACAAVTDPFRAAVAATVWLNSAGELAAERAKGPGSFRVELLDALDEVGR